MINWLTIAVIIILLLELLIGWKKGLIRMVFSFAISIVTFVIILVTGPYVEQYIKENTSIYEKMEASISVFVQENLQQNISEMTQTQEESVVTQLPLPEFIQNMLTKDNTVEQYVTMLPKSITTAIGMGISEELGGIVTITVAVIIITGILGNVIADFIFRIFHIKDPIAKGLALGTSAHAIGTAKAMEIGPVEGAMSSLSIAVAGLFTVIGASIFAGFM